MNLWEKKNGDHTERNWIMDVEWMESEPPPVSIEYRTVIGIVDRGLNSTNHMPEVGGSQNR